MSAILDRVKRLYPYHYSVVSQGSDDAVPAWLAELPFHVREYPSGTEINGWLAGDKWRATKAEIRKDGKLIYDGLSSPLGVITNSDPFAGKVSGAELRKHLFFSDRIPEAIVYHWTKLYRPAERNWGFCLPKRIYDTLSDGEYDVVIETDVAPGSMKVMDYLLPGDSTETIVLNAHNCHPFQANDDISGCAVGIEVLKRLATLPRRRYSYRLVIAPELIGTSFWLRDVAQEGPFVAAILLKSVGHKNPLRLQESFTGQAKIDRAAHHVLRNRYGTYESGAFRTLYGNDETVFESPGYKIPTISLTRMTYQDVFDSYHTDHDTPDGLSEASLQDTAEAALEVCMALECDKRYEVCVDGLVALSHPRYDLYLTAGAIGIEKEEFTAVMLRWNLLMNALPRHLDDGLSLLDIAIRHDLPVGKLHDYVERWISKGLLKPLS